MVRPPVASVLALPRSGATRNAGATERLKIVGRTITDARSMALRASLNGGHVPVASSRALTVANHEKGGSYWRSMDDEVSRRIAAVPSIEPFQISNEYVPEISK